jgi:hypothetical protein
LAVTVTPGVALARETIPTFETGGAIRFGPAVVPVDGPMTLMNAGGVVAALFSVPVTALRMRDAGRG